MAERSKIPRDDNTSNEPDYHPYEELPLRTNGDEKNSKTNTTDPNPTSNAFGNVDIGRRSLHEQPRGEITSRSSNDPAYLQLPNQTSVVRENLEVSENVNSRFDSTIAVPNAEDDQNIPSNGSPPPMLPARDYQSTPPSRKNTHYELPREQIDVKSKYQVKRDVPNIAADDHVQSLTFYEMRKKVYEFNNKPKEFIDKFESTKDETRTAEETFLIIHLLTSSDPKSPVLNGQLDQLAMLACCNSPRVVKRALDVLLNEIFLSISDSSETRCHNILEAEEILRSSFFEFLKVDRFKPKCHRMTTYAWLITLFLLKCDEKEFTKIQSKIKEFDRELSTLLNSKDNKDRNLFRYGLYLARESIERIIQSCKKPDRKESLILNIKKCKYFLNGELDKDEVMKLGRELSDANSWLDIHVCLVFMQDLPKFYQYQGDLRPVILLQMLIADYRERCGGKRLFTRVSTESWLFEVLVYRLMLRLVRTSKHKAIIDQVLTGEQGCGGVLGQLENDNSSKPSKDEFVAKLHEKLCERVVFISTPQIIKQFLEDRCIEDLSILHLSSKYRYAILEILQESRIQLLEQRVSTYDALMSGRKCLLKLHLHSKEEIPETEPGVSSLRDEIEILSILNAVPEPCQNIVRLLGSTVEAPMHMIIEKASKNDLLTYLHDFTKPPQGELLLYIALDICNAMIFLGENNVIHRDLCAKSCFVFDPNGSLVIKLGNFHLSSSLSRSQTDTDSQSSSMRSSIKGYSENQFAVRWMAVEALRDGEFSFASDVWSFGVLLYEIFTFGSKPYVNMPNGMSLDIDEEVREYVLEGNKLELHPKIPDSIQNVIQSTFTKKDDRPTFSELNSHLREITFDDEIYMDPVHYKKLHHSLSSLRVTTE
ncbi:uncharacterized protein LOC114534200 [Dendronephthya gigantea]|uniref:uncharacterized protein LOC114534200 n=1 Tax=Dendronephthya gigantea TaxID=151771 RepID=UPI00106B35CD|nr:uncharacterized protein LOC114534200 [Dendronephthya gigantea]XP_028411555.1 uncharacterized protein LOC114534200 [Dendronephthya gigantea]